MEIISKLLKFSENSKMSKAVVICGVTGLLLIALSSVCGNKGSKDKSESENYSISACEYCAETEKRLEKFLNSIDGAGKVKVYLTVNTDERYIYATENRISVSDDRREEEKSYVMTGNGGERKALVETVEIPNISGAVIACDGYDSAVVQERIYKAVSAALNLETGKIYVTKLG